MNQLIDIARGAYSRLPPRTRASLASFFRFVPEDLKWGSSYRAWRRLLTATQDNPALVEEHCGRARLAMIEVAARNSPYYRALFADLFGPGYAPEQVLDAAYWTRINVASRFGTRAHSVIPPSPDGCSVAPYRPVATSTTTALTVEKRL